MKERFSTARAAQIIDVSTKTLKMWYKWWEDDSYEKPVGLSLPEYTTDGRGTRFFTYDAVQALEVFKQAIRNEYKGCMAEFNAINSWGQRGTRILGKKKEEDN